MNKAGSEPFHYVDAIKGKYSIKDNITKVKKKTTLYYNIPLAQFYFILPELNKVNTNRAQRIACDTVKCTN